jgi:hypothetical protein
VLTLRLAARDFCLDAKRRHTDGPFQQTKHYNSNSDDEMDMRITFYAKMDISADDCQSAFARVIDDCDADATTNPANLKHGGSLNYQGGQAEGGAVLEVIPSHGNHRMTCTPLDSNTWMWQPQLDSDIKTFCSWAVSYLSPCYAQKDY